MQDTYRAHNALDHFHRFSTLSLFIFVPMHGLLQKKFFFTNKQTLITAENHSKIVLNFNKKIMQRFLNLFELLNKKLNKF